MEINTDPVILKGAFVDTLKRSNKQIKNDRAGQIGESAARFYKRKVEDIADEIKNLKTKRKGLLDLSPTNAQSLMPANDFKADEFVALDMKLGLEIRDLEIELKLGLKRYNELFEGEVEETPKSED